MATSTNTPRKAPPPRKPTRNTPSKPAGKQSPPTQTDYSDVNETSNRIRRNIHTLKTKLGMTDEQIATRGGYTSRQVFYSRLNGRTDFSMEDFNRIAAALSVDNTVLLFNEEWEVLRWVAEHPDYQPPNYPPQTAKGE